MSIAPANPLGFEWQQTMFRIRDPKLSVPFYVTHFGFQLLHEMHFDEWGFSLYFLGILPAEDAASWPQPGTPEAGKRLFTMRGVTLELTWNHGTEADVAHQTNNGNVGPHRGFSSVGISARDLTVLKAELVASGLRVFEAGDDCEAWMRGRTYCVDPDGYWVQLSQRPADSAVTHQLTLGSVRPVGVSFLLLYQTQVLFVSTDHHASQESGSVAPFLSHTVRHVGCCQLCC
jgi:lactoylglutathione lyase